MNIVGSTSDDWKVEIENIPMVQAFPQFNEMEEFKEKQIIITEDHKRLFSVLSSKSVVVRHEEALQTINDAVHEAYGNWPEINISVLKKGASIRAKFDMPWLDPVEIEPGDKSTMHLFLYNSYDKAVPFKLRVGYYREICMNGMLVGDNIASLTSKQLLDGWSAEGLTNKITKMVEDAGNVGDIWTKWKDVKLKFEDVEDFLDRRMPNKLVSNLSPAAFPMSMWDLYMDLTNRVTHDSKTERSKISLDSVVSGLFYNPNGPLKDVYEQQPELTHRLAA